MKTVLIKTLGCKVNTYESEFIRHLFLENDYTEVFEENADVCIINTCSVTNTADSKSKKIINNIRKNNPKAIVIAVGCFCQNKKNVIESLIDADIILGNKDKSKILDYIKEFEKNKKRIIKFYDMDNQIFEDMDIKKYTLQHRAFIKIEDGCNNFCSYCIIPYVRGRVRSKNFDKVIDEVCELKKNGHKEIVLSGIHTGQYNFEGKSLSDLINELINKTKIKRIRLSSVEIVELKEDMVDIIKNKDEFASHLHVPLQSGCDKILKLMNRRYDTDLYRRKIKQLKDSRKNISLTTDVIVGFPGETEEDFKQTLEFCNEMKFSKIHVFPYSDREGTIASKMTNKVDSKVKKERVKKLLELSSKLERQFYESCIGDTEIILIEEYKNGYYYGHTSNYLYLKLYGNYEINNFYKIVIKMENFV